jgi:hypothetical protein
MLTSLGLLYLKSMKSGGTGLNIGGSSLDVNESIDLFLDFSMCRCIEDSWERTLKRSYALVSSLSHFLISSASLCFFRTS